MADVDDLPNDFDIVVLGTGLTETIAAAAFSRIGLKVLHLDRNNFYGGSFANFNLQGIEEWKTKNEELQCSQIPDFEVNDDLKKLAGDGYQIYSLPRERAQAHNIKTSFHVRQMTEKEKDAVEESKKKSRTRTYSNQVMLSEFTITYDKSTEEPQQTQQAINDTKIPPSTDQSISGPELQKEEHKNLTTGDRNESATTNEQQLDQPQVPQGACSGDGLLDGQEERNKNSRAEDKDKAVEQDVGTEFSTQCNLKEDAESKIMEWTVEAIQDDWRKYCFDLSPRVLYCSGELVELLIQSDVARYCEFRTVSRVLTLLNDAIQQVPCSRADVFSSKIVSLVEKRLMMKFLQFAADYESQPDEYKEYKDMPFVEFLKSKKLTANVQHFVQHAIAMTNDVAATEVGLKRTQRFLRSLGRYGNTAFLFSLYGSGELPQAFSRLSAVFGGTYCLMMSASQILADQENKCCGIITTTGKKINCKYLVAEASYLPSTFVQHPANKQTSRAIFITDKSICESKDPELSLLNFACKDRPDNPVTIMELPSSACVCPKGLYVIHLIRECGSDDPEKDFSEVVQRLFAHDSDSPSKPKILWSLYFTQNDLSQASLTPGAVGNIFVTSGGGDALIDMERCVGEAKQIFCQVCPDEEFLPKPPNPEDIIYVDDEEATVSKGPGEFDVEEKEEGKEGGEHKQVVQQEKQHPQQEVKQ